jgi:hypothetical protein
MSDHTDVDQLDTLSSGEDTSAGDTSAGQGYADAIGSPATVLDIDENGVPDSVAVELAPGVTGLVVDVDEDGRPDTVLVDTDGDGAYDTQVCPDGAGGFVLGFDDDGDGTVDREETITRAELEELSPGLADVLDPLDGVPDGVDTPDDTGGGEPDWSVQDGRIIGDPTDASEHWFQQAANGFCVPASIAQIVSEYTGETYTDELAFVEIANQLGVWVVGPDGAPGLTDQGALAVLEQAGVPAAIVSGGGIDMLADYLDTGHGVMVSIDSGEVWYGEAAEDNTADHMVVVAGIDVDRGLVLLSDTGTPDGNLEEVPIEVFMDAWADSDYAMVVAEEPAPEDAADPDPGSDGSAMSSSMSSQVATLTAATVTSPWALLPVTLSHQDW